MRIGLIYLSLLIIDMVIVGKILTFYRNAVQSTYVQQITEPRADIIDRQGHKLAYSTKVFSVYAHPNKLSTTKLMELKPILEPTVFAHVLKSRPKFIWIDRYSSNPQRYPEFELMREYKREYPFSSSSTHIIGLVDADQKPLFGLEKQLSNQTLQLTINAHIQQEVFRVLTQYCKDLSATFGCATVVNLHTGEILALTCSPEVNLKQSTTLFNHCTQGLYELGSVMKFINLGLVLDKGKFTLESMLDVPEFYQYSKFQIKDAGINRTGMMSVLDGMRYSSNKMQIMTALASATTTEQLDFFQRMGLFDPIHLGVPVAKTVRPVRWTKGQMISSSFGYALAVTPLHFIQAFARLITGKRIVLSLIKSPVQQFDTCFNHSEQMRIALRACAEQGFARPVYVHGLNMGAKTGTAMLLNKGVYDKQRHRVCTIAAFQLNKEPAYGVFVMMEINSAQFGGQTAGLAVKQIIKNIAPLLNVWVHV